MDKLKNWKINGLEPTTTYSVIDVGVDRKRMPDNRIAETETDLNYNVTHYVYLSDSLATTTTSDMSPLFASGGTGGFYLVLLATTDR